MLLHSPQGEDNTCMYRATYALTHDPEWLTLSRQGDPGSDSLWLSRLAQAGILCYAQHVSQQAYGPPVGPQFWTWFRAHAHAIGPGEVGLVVTVWGRTMYHAVAVLLDTESGGVTVSDSREEILQTFAWPAFLTSRYAQAYRVEMLMHFWPPES